MIHSSIGGPQTVIPANNRLMDDAQQQHSIGSRCDYLTLGHNSWTELMTRMREDEKDSHKGKDGLHIMTENIHQIAD